jgi:hypothetical protein
MDIGVSAPSEADDDLPIFDISDEALERAVAAPAATLISCSLDTSCSPIWLGPPLHRERGKAPSILPSGNFQVPHG